MLPLTVDSTHFTANGTFLTADMTQYGGGVLAATDETDVATFTGSTLSRLMAVEASDVTAISGSVVVAGTLSAIEATDVGSSIVLLGLFGRIAAIEALDKCLLFQAYTPPARKIKTPTVVPDIFLKQNAIYPRYSVTLDWELLGDGTLDDRYALATSVCIALGTNALADFNDRLPDPDSTDRQGWWGDLDCQEIWRAWPIGSKLWLLRRSAIEGPNAQRGATIALVNNYIQAALQPFIDNKICSSYKVVSQRTSKQQITSLITIYRGPEPSIELRFDSLWDGVQV